jgi:predicted AAA+ superfamily ATPase
MKKLDHLKCVKAQLHRGNLPNLYFFRDSSGLEVDILWQKGRQLIQIAVKSSATYHPSLIKGLNRFQKVLSCDQQYLIYAGDVEANSEGVTFARFVMIQKYLDNKAFAKSMLSPNKRTRIKDRIEGQT